MDKRTCDECRFAVNEDNGYSNWTVEGTEFSCAKKLHPNGTFDRFYGANPKLDYAEKCQGFEAGEGIDMDVECDGVADLTPEKKIVWDMHQEPMAIEQHIKGGGNGN